jgi:hypothetical protein
VAQTDINFDTPYGMFSRSGEIIVGEVVNEITGLLRQNSITAVITAMIQVIAEQQGAGPEVNDTAVREAIAEQMAPVLTEKVAQAFNMEFVV